MAAPKASADQKSEQTGDDRAGNAYYVVHQISAHTPGSVICFTAQQLRAPGHNGGMGVSIDRLLALGAMRDATKDEIKAAPPVQYGTGDAVADLVPLPAVPYDVTPLPNTTGTSSIKELGAENDEGNEGGESS